MNYKVYNLLAEFNTNAYLLWDEVSLEAVIIDPANESKILKKEILKLKLNIKYIINTHGHGDHIGGNAFFVKSFPKSKLCIHKEDALMLLYPELNLSMYWDSGVVSPASEIQLAGGDVLKLGENELKIIHTPGHTEGGISIYVDNLVFAGDTLFARGIGRTDLPGGNYDTLINSIREKLFKLPKNTIVLPGHGSETTIGLEMAENPFVNFQTH
ncbi:MAG: MBL fold metallo-hydrolase [Armatimonadetes bacterium]|nr:MBL fold metallo-hydrolase [Armatimonadota bacterium]